MPGRGLGWELVNLGENPRHEYSPSLRPQSPVGAGGSRVCPVEVPLSMGGETRARTEDTAVNIPTCRPPAATADVSDAKVSGEDEYLTIKASNKSVKKRIWQCARKRICTLSSTRETSPMEHCHPGISCFKVSKSFQEVVKVVQKFENRVQPVRGSSSHPFATKDVPFCPKKPTEFCFCLCELIVVCRRVVSEQSLWK